MNWMLPKLEIVQTAFHYMQPMYNIQKHWTVTANQKVLCHTSRYQKPNLTPVRRPDLVGWLWTPIPSRQGVIWQLGGAISSQNLFWLISLHVFWCQTNVYDTVGGPNDIPYWFFMCKNLAVIFDIIGFSSLSLAQTIDHRGNFLLTKAFVCRGWPKLMVQSPDVKRQCISGKLCRADVKIAMKTYSCVACWSVTTCISASTFLYFRRKCGLLASHRIIVIMLTWPFKHSLQLGCSQIGGHWGLSCIKHIF